MARVTTTPGRDAEKPLVAHQSNSRAGRLGVQLLRGYLAVGVIAGLLAGLVLIVFLLSLH